jgi:hypothetical protein
MNNEEKIKQAVKMIDEMLSLAEQQDEKHKAQAIAAGQGERAVGESWEIFHLKTLKSLLEEDVTV